MSAKARGSSSSPKHQRDTLGVAFNLHNLAPSMHRDMRIRMCALQHSILGRAGVIAAFVLFSSCAGAAGSARRTAVSVMLGYRSHVRSKSAHSSCILHLASSPAGDSYGKPAENDKSHGDAGEHLKDAPVDGG